MPVTRLTRAEAQQTPASGPATVTPWNSPFLLQLGAYGMSVVLLQGLRFVVSVVCARAVSPAEWGLWTLLNTLLAYSFVADLGVTNGMNREIPFFRGRQDYAHAERVENASRSFVLCSSAACMLAVVIYAQRRSGPDRPILFAFAILLLCYKFFTYAQTYSMAHDDFGRVTKSNLTLAVLTPVACLPLVLYFRLSGFVYAQILTFVVGGLLYIKPLSASFRWSPERDELLALAKAGAPIALVGITAALVSSIDRWLVNAFWGVRAVGYYSLVAMTWGTVNLIPQVVAARIYPQMAAEWGRSGNPQSLTRMAKRYTLLGLTLTLPVVLVAELAGPHVVRALLPSYQPGIDAMRIAALGFLVQPAIYSYVNLFNVIGKQQYILAVQAVTLVGAIALVALLFALGWGIEGAALGTAIAAFLCAAGFSVAATRALESL